MSKSKSAVPTVGGATYDADKIATLTHRLITPVEHNGARIETVTLTEPRAFDSVKADAEAAKGGNRLEHLLAAISDLPPGAKLRTRDFGRIARWLQALVAEALEADGIAQTENAAEADPFALDEVEAAASAMPDAEIDALEGEREFTLCVPFEFKGRRVETVTATEPTIDAMLAGEKFKTPAQQTIALIAAVTGESIPTVNRFALRDINRIEAWLAPFVRDLMSASTGGA